jgi:hypothetical protein
MNHTPFALPRLTALIKQAVPRLLEGVVAPLVVFYMPSRCSACAAR